jgi:hypothetical protein
MTSGGGSTFTWKGAIETTPNESVARMVKVEVPCALDAGVPLITPVAAFKKSPAGNAPEASDQLMGAMPPVATSAAE